MSIVVVTTAAITKDLIDLDDVKEELGIEGATDDSKLQRWVTAASARFASACGCVIAAETVTETFRGAWGYRELALSRLPVISVTSVTEDAGALLASDYEINSESGLAHRLAGNSVIKWCAQKIVVAYRGGFEQTPADISDAILSLMRHKWNSSDRDPLLKSFQVEGVGREDYWVPLQSGDTGGLPPDLQPVADTIARYRRLAFA